MKGLVLVAAAFGTVAPQGGALSSARAALAQGDLLTWLELRGDGAAPSAGWAHLDDLAALMRCRPLPPGGEGADRRLLELEAARLRRFLVDGAHATTDLPQWVRASAWLRLIRPVDDPSVVRWPVEDELWSDEAPLVAPRDSACSTVARPEGALGRRRAEQVALARVLSVLPELPPTLRAPAVALYLEASARAGPNFEIPPALAAKLYRAAVSGTGPHREVAVVLSARALLRTGARRSDMASQLAPIAQQAGPLAPAARVAWVLAVVDTPAEVLAATESLRPEASVVRAWLDHHRARALYATDDVLGLERFGRVFARRRTPGPVDARTFGILMNAQVERPPGVALAAAASFGGSEPQAVRRRWWSLARRALDRKRWAFAEAVLDRLWLEAKSQVPPPSDLVEIIGARAQIALARAQGGRFATLIDELEKARPSGRRRRALGALAQRALAVLPTTPPPIRRPIAARILETLRAQRRLGRPLARSLREAEPTWRAWAGEPPLRAPQLSRRRVPSPLVPLGEVEVSRALAPAPKAPEVSVVVPPVPSFVVWYDAAGQRQVGLPPYAQAERSEPEAP